MEKITTMIESKAIAEIEQEIEVLLSYDFYAMSLNELKNIEKEIQNLLSINYNLYKFDGAQMTKTQRKTFDNIFFLITKKENENDTVKIGDVFFSSWGYDQTNVEMFKVVGFTKSGKSAEIKQIYTKTVKDSEGYMSDSVEADLDGEFDKPKLRVKIERDMKFNPMTQKREPIGEIQLRGSVYIGIGENKHLQTLSRLKKGSSTYRSWYA